MEGFHFHAGHFFTGLTVVEVMLHDERPGDGGLCVIPGSRKGRTFFGGLGGDACVLLLKCR